MLCFVLSSSPAFVCVSFLLNRVNWQLVWKKNTTAGRETGEMWKLFFARITLIQLLDSAVLTVYII